MRNSTLPIGWRFIALGLLVGAGCRAPEAVPAAAPMDPEGVAVTWLRDQVFDDAQRQAPRFVPGLSASTFPPRLMVDRVDEYAFVDLWRLREVDGQVLVEALVEIAGVPHIQGLRLKRMQESWRIAGWEGPPRPATGDGAGELSDLSLPDDLAVAVLRGARASAVLPVEAPVEGPETEEEAAPPVDVGLTVAAWEGDCNAKKRLTQTLNTATKALARCGASLSGRGGRLTWSVRFEGGTPRPVVSLLETTLLDQTVAACGQAAFEALPAAVAPGATCTPTVRVTLRPK